jgi:hypothetical protein
MDKRQEAFIQVLGKVAAVSEGSYLKVFSDKTLTLEVPDIQISKLMQCLIGRLSFR